MPTELSPLERELLERATIAENALADRERSDTPWIIKLNQMLCTPMGKPAVQAAYEEIVELRERLARAEALAKPDLDGAETP